MSKIQALLYIPVLLFMAASETIAYEQQDAIIYALDHYENYNEKYDNFSPADCANFISQCLIAGGIRTDDDEILKKAGIPKWMVKKGGVIYNCKSLGKYLKRKGAGYNKITTINDIPLGLSSGDVVIFQHKVLTCKWHAVIIVAGRGKSALYAAHTSDTDDGKLSLYLNKRQKWVAHIYKPADIRLDENGTKKAEVSEIELKEGEGYINGFKKIMRYHGGEKFVADFRYYKLTITNARFIGVEFKEDGTINVTQSNWGVKNLQADVKVEIREVIQGRLREIAPTEFTSTLTGYMTNELLENRGRYQYDQRGFAAASVSLYIPQEMHYRHYPVAEFDDPDAPDNAMAPFNVMDCIADNYLQLGLKYDPGTNTVSFSARNLILSDVPWGGPPDVMEAHGKIKPKK